MLTIPLRLSAILSEKIVCVHNFQQKIFLFVFFYCFLVWFYHIIDSDRITRLSRGFAATNLVVSAVFHCEPKLRTDREEQSSTWLVP